MVPPIFLALVLVLALVLLLQASFVLWPFGNDELSAIAVWQQLFTQPALLSSIAISLGTGLAASLLAFVVAIGLLALLFHRPGWNLRTNHRFYLLLALLLAVPHASVAIGFSLLFSAEGWLLRLVSPWLTGWHRPPDLAIVPDPWGLALIFGLFARELPFMVLIALAAQAGLRDEGRAFLMAQNCGYGRLAAFANAYGPRLYASMRPGCLIVVAYSVSVVDMALLLAPTRPEMLAVRVTSWQQEVQGFSHGAAGALLQIGVAILAMGIWEVGAKSAGYALRLRARLGQRRLRLTAPSVMFGKFLGFTALASMMICILMLGLWSIAGYWRFPAILPDSWTLQQFQQGGR
ncbi:MAG: ABC transporter permease, partial [Pseudomonadota bacterium]